jgi:predicted HAD superfamily Cof-like phosphohydrolase
MQIEYAIIYYTKEQTMKTNPIADIREMLEYYKFTPEQLNSERLEFRLQLLLEEYTETRAAADENDAAELVDGLIDIVVIALGTLELAGVDVERAWQEVHRANMSKIRGAKPGRTSDGWDLYKPLNWTAPNHSDNTGNLNNILKGENK